MEEPSSEPRETKPANLVLLKTAASSLRDTILQVCTSMVLQLTQVYLNAMLETSTALNNITRHCIIALYYILLHFRLRERQSGRVKGGAAPESVTRWRNTGEPPLTLLLPSILQLYRPVPCLHLPLARKALNELEAQLVLASPHLLFQVTA